MGVKVKRQFKERIERDHKVVLSSFQWLSLVSVTEGQLPAVWRKVFLTGLSSACCCPPPTSSQAAPQPGGKLGTNRPLHVHCAQSCSSKADVCVQVLTAPLSHKTQELFVGLWCPHLGPAAPSGETVSPDQLPIPSLYMSLPNLNNLHEVPHSHGSAYHAFT